jgi:RNA polymerase sigma-70 factor (ECF subfamily)
VGWITSITRNLAFDRLRARARDPESLDALGIDCGSEPDTESRWLRAERGLILRKALAALSFEQRHAIELAYFSGLSHAEIAKDLKQPLGTIKTRIRIGLINPRSLLPAAQ